MFIWLLFISDLIIDSNFNFYCAFWISYSIMFTCIFIYDGSHFINRSYHFDNVDHIDFSRSIRCFKWLWNKIISMHAFELHPISMIRFNILIYYSNTLCLFSFSFLFRSFFIQLLIISWLFIFNWSIIVSTNLDPET